MLTHLTNYIPHQFAVNMFHKPSSKPSESNMSSSWGFVLHSIRRSPSYVAIYYGQVGLRIEPMSRMVRGSEKRMTRSVFYSIPCQTKGTPVNDTLLCEEFLVSKELSTVLVTRVR